MLRNRSEDPPVASDDQPVPRTGPKYQRITASLRAAVVELYESGQTSRQVAEELALGRTTVLKILEVGRCDRTAARALY